MLIPASTGINVCLFALKNFTAYTFAFCALCGYRHVRECMAWHVCEGQRTAWRTRFSPFHHVAPEGWTPAVRLGGKPLYWLSHLLAPTSLFLETVCLFTFWFLSSFLCLSPHLPKDKTKLLAGLSSICNSVVFCVLNF